MLKFEKKVLDNGLRVVLAPMENSEAVTIQVLVGVGSKNETKNINGISHFLEHLFFKGTKQRPNAGDVNRELDRIGASHNAFTSNEITGFWVKSSVKDFDIGLDIVSDILLEPLFKKEEIEKERGVILQEISMYEDLPQRNIIDVLLNVMYGDQPAGWSIAGTKETVGRISRDDVLSYKEKNYLAKNMTVVVAGGINKKIVLGKISKIFKKIKEGESKAREKTEILQKSPAIRFLNKKSDQSHLAMGIKSYDMFDDRRYSLNLLSVILGGNPSSRLFMEIREKCGLAYYVGSAIELQTDLGILLIRAGVSHDNLGKTTKKIIEILAGLKTNGVSKKELDDTKSFIRGQTALSLETSDQVADFCGEQELFYKKIMQPEEILKKIEKVSQYDILKTARDIFRPEKINMAVIGQQEDNEKNQELYKNIFSKI